MHQPKETLPIQMEGDGVIMRSTPWGGMAANFQQMPGGLDLTPMFRGLPDDACQCPHWGYVIEGSVHVGYTDGSEETVRAGDVYHWPAGHTVSFTEDAQFVEFSPEHEMAAVVGHVQAQAAAAAGA